VAYCIAHPFWKDWRKLVRSINPEAYLTAEIVRPPEQVKPYLEGDEFDGEMNYNFAFASAEFFFNEGESQISAGEYDAKLKELRDAYPQGVAYVSQNLFGSHDANRIGSYVVNRGNDIGNFRDWGDYFGASSAINNPNYSPRKPQAEDIELQKLFVIMQMTYVGAPMIYYGDEVGMWGGNDPDCRKPMVWDDIAYDDEVTNPDGSLHAPDKVAVNHDLLDHYKKMITIRNNHPALQVGSYKTILTDDDKGILIFERKYKRETIFVVINNGVEPYKFDASILGDVKYTDLISGGEFGEKVTVAPKWGLVLTK
jgi:glycosidase